MSVADILAAFPPGERTLPVMLQRQARRYGSHRLFTAGDVSWSFADAPRDRGAICRHACCGGNSDPAIAWR